MKPTVHSQQARRCVHKLELYVEILWLPSIIIDSNYLAPVSLGMSFWRYTYARLLIALYPSILFFSYCSLSILNARASVNYSSNLRSLER